MGRIMIIDSDIRQMRELNEGLSPHFQILNCSRGAQAMDLFKLYQPSAVILDPSTPQFQCREFVRQLRLNPGGSRLPILALTRITTLKLLEQSFDWGADMIFSKPCTAEKIKKKLSEYFTGPIPALGAGTATA